MNKKIILFGEYLLRLTPPSQQKLLQASELEMHWAGSEANTGVSLSILGDNPVYVTCLPNNVLANAGLAQLHKYKLTTEVIKKEEGRVGLYFYEAGSGARGGRILYDRSYSSFSLLQTGDINWDNIFADADWFHWSGITPALNKNLAAICTEALQQAKEKGVTISADFNYRSTLWQYGVACNNIMPGLLSFCDVILADVDTAKLYFGIEPDTSNLVESTCVLLKEKLPGVKYIAMTMRHTSGSGSSQYQGYLWQDGKLFSSAPYNLQQVAERIGAGDAFMAGLLFSLRQNKSSQESIEFATACGVIKHNITGDFNIASLNEINTVIQQQGKSKIIR